MSMSSILLFPNYQTTKETIPCRMISGPSFNQRKVSSLESRCRSPAREWNGRWLEAPSCAVHQNGNLRPARAHSTYINVYYTYIFPRLVTTSLYPSIPTWGLPLHSDFASLLQRPHGGLVTQDVDSLAKQCMQGMRHERVSRRRLKTFLIVEVDNQVRSDHLLLTMFTALLYRRVS